MRSTSPVRCRSNPLRVAVLIAGLALALLAGPAGAAAAPGTNAAKLEAALDRIVASEGGPPGVSVLIQRGGKREYRRRGFADVRRGLRPNPRLPMRIASVSKAYSGAIAMALVARGQLSLNDTVGERLPGLLPRAKKVTLRQALNHVGGLPDYIHDEAFLRVLQRHPERPMAPRRLLSYVRDTPLRFRPGTKYEYSDTDNVVVGLMAEAATGKSYNRLLRDLIFRPLKLRQTSLPRSMAIKSPFLHGYDIPAPQPAREAQSSAGYPGESAGHSRGASGSAGSPGGASEPPEDVSRVINPALAWASGGMVSTPADLNRFMRAYVGGRLTGGSAARHGFRPGSSSPPGPGRNAAGLGLFRYRTPCGTVFGHTGSFPGYRMFAAATRDGRRSVVFAVNAQIVPGLGSPAVSNLIRRAQTLAVCHALR